MTDDRLYTEPAPFRPILIGKRREFNTRDFFEMGQEESASPFLTPFARRISHNFPLKTSVVAAILLLISYFIFHFTAYSPFGTILLGVVFVIVGVPALIHAVEDVILHRDCNIDVLMTLAAFSAIFLGSGFEGALLLVLFALSGAIEDYVSLKAKSALIQLHRLVPTKAYCIEDNEVHERAIQDVALGTSILVRAGEIVPLDGTVTSGASSVSLVHLTGESVPIRKSVGDDIPSGARVIDGSLTVRVTHLSQDSTVSQIVKLITKAEKAKPVLERTFDTFSRRYALSIILLSLLIGSLFPLLLDISYFGKEGSIYRSLAFLITASPCALILAVPIAYLSALGSCAKRGIVLKGGIVLDALKRCSIVAFDKTGTLTLGELELDSTASQEVLSLAASLERNAVHPIAKAIMKKAQSEKVPLVAVENVHVIPGYGVEGTYQGKKLFIGDAAKAEELIPHQEYARLDRESQELQKAGKIVACLVVGSHGYLFAFSDRPRKGISKMLQALKRRNLRLLMLTGDHYESAERIAKTVGIESFEADLKPQDKLDRIEKLSKNEGLAMVGDGINDAPALARATCGICMGQVGSATARSVADVILLHDNIEYLDWLFGKAEVTRKIVIQNLCIAAVAIICGSIPAIGGLLPLWLAVIVHEGGTVLVGLNALRLLSNKT